MRVAVAVAIMPKARRPHVDPTGCTTLNWMRTNLQDGMMTVEIQMLLAACEPYGLTRAQVKANLQDPAGFFPPSQGDVNAMTQSVWTLAGGNGPEQGEVLGE